MPTVATAHTRKNTAHAPRCNAALWWRGAEQLVLSPGVLYPFAILLTEAGLVYDTGLRERILHGSDH